jgi:hypothetical protein
MHLEAVAGDCRILVNGKEAGFHFDTSLPGNSTSLPWHLGQGK